MKMRWDRYSRSGTPQVSRASGRSWGTVDAITFPRVPCTQRNRAALSAAARFSLVAVPAVLIGGVACSKDDPPAASKSAVTVSPDLAAQLNQAMGREVIQ